MGELASLASSALWAMASLLYARLGVSIHALALNLLKGLIASVLLLTTIFLLFLLGQAPLFWPDRTGLQLLIWSGLLGIAVGDTAYFLALNRLRPRRALLFSALTPPLTTILAALFLQEAFTPAMLGGIALTLAGVIWVVRERQATTAPSTTHKTMEQNAEKAENTEKTTDKRFSPPPSAAEKADEMWGIAFAILSSLCQSVGNILTRKGGAALPALSIATIRIMAGLLGLALVVLLVGRLGESLRPLRRPEQAKPLLLATFFGTFLCIWLSMAGLRYTTFTGIATTLNSTSPIFILPLAAIFLGERISLRAILGACLAVAGIGLLFWVR
jgi:drug/metabolite transporter (DMT)-like permease